MKSVEKGVQGREDGRTCLLLNRTTKKDRNVLIVGSGDDRVEIEFLSPANTTIKLRIRAPENVLIDREEVRIKKGFY